MNNKLYSSDSSINISVNSVIDSSVNSSIVDSSVVDSSVIEKFRSIF